MKKNVSSKQNGNNVSSTGRKAEENRTVEQQDRAGEGRIVRLELWMMLDSLKGARSFGETFLKECPGSENIADRMAPALEKINDAMNDVAAVIGWDVLERIELDG